MPCTPFSIGGARGFICTRGRAYGGTYRCACGKVATLQCDAPSKRKSGTCDAHICHACATEIGPDRHLCRAHATSGFQASNEAASQGSLF